MSGAGGEIPYHLRTAKAADRRLFIDLLRRLERWIPLDHHVYVSMGGYPMADHHRVYRVLGLRNMLSFDEDGAVVPRQAFNKPNKDCRCIEMASSDLVSNPRAAYSAAGIRDCPNHIVWLDYTKPSNLRQHLDDVVSLIRASDEGDILRVTLNANPSAIRGAQHDLPKKAKQDARLATLRRELGDYLPEDVERSHISDKFYPKLLVRILRNALSSAVAANLRVVPVSIVTYADGHRMVAATMVVVSGESSVGEPHQKAKLQYWPLASRRWDEIHDLRIATLTSRERAHLDFNLPTVPALTLLKGLKFSLFPDMGIEDAAAYLDRYEGLLRFYPNFLAVD